MCKIYVVGEKLVNVSKIKFMSPMIAVDCWIYSNGLVVPKNWRSIPSHISITGGNDKVGKDEAIMFNLPIFVSCLHGAPCFATEDGGKAPCYACGGLFTMYGNVILPPWGNFNALSTMSEDEFFEAMVTAIDEKLRKNKKIRIFRWMEQGDFVPKLIRVAIRLAEHYKGRLEFYGYTKKYILWNSYVESHGGSLAKAIPSNLTIRFSKWVGLEMDNRYGFPISAFSPADEDLQVSGTDCVCPCADPEWSGSCCECRQCIDNKGTVYLKEHSTSLSAKWDTIAHDGQKYCKLSEKLAMGKTLSVKDTKAFEGAKKRLEKRGIDLETLRPSHTVKSGFDAKEWLATHSKKVVA